MSALVVRGAGRFPHSLGCTVLGGGALRVWARNGNRSAFNGYRWTPSAYSLVVCDMQHAGCGGLTRTKAAYVAALPDG